MNYRPRTNQDHIEMTLKKLQKGLIRVQDCDLNKRFDRLHRDNKIWYDELYPKYVAIAHKLSQQKII